MKKIGQNTTWLLKKINYINDFFTPCKMPRGVNYIKSVECKHLITNIFIQSMNLTPFSSHEMYQFN